MFKVGDVVQIECDMDFTVNPDAIEIAKQRSEEKELLHFCLQEKVCPKCAGDLNSDMGSDRNWSYNCTNEKCDFIWSPIPVPAVPSPPPKRLIKDGVKIVHRSS